MTREQHLERGLKRVTEVTHEDEWVNQVAVQFLCEADEMLEENIYLNRLKEQYIHHKKSFDLPVTSDEMFKRKDYYNAMRLFCLDTQLLSFNEIEVMEDEINRSF